MKILALLTLTVATGLQASDDGARSPSRPTGIWEVTGRALSVQGVANESPGAVLKRRWLFQTTCEKIRCRTAFLRTTAYRVERAELVPHHGYYTASFGPSPVGCEGLPGMPGRFRAHYRLWWSRNHAKLVADERAVYSGGRCASGASRTRWTAVRAGT